MNKKINSSNCTFLVKDDSMKNGGTCDFVKWLRTENYSSWGCKGWYGDVNWIFINISTMVYAPGVPGANIAGVIGDHSITIDEFKLIHNIFKKYKGLDMLRMNKAEQDEWDARQKYYTEMFENYWANTTYENYIDDVVECLKTKYSVPSDKISQYLKSEEKTLKEQFEQRIMPGSTAYLLDLMW